MARETPGRLKNIRQPCSGKLRGMAGIVSGPHVQSGPGSILTINSMNRQKFINSVHEVTRRNPYPTPLEEIAELREKEAVRNTTAARAALLLALDGVGGDYATLTGGVCPDGPDTSTSTGGHYATLTGGVCPDGPDTSTSTGGHYATLTGYKLPPGTTSQNRHSSGGLE